MLSGQLEAALKRIEKQFQDLSVALVNGEPVALESASVAMRQASIDFSAFVQGLSRAERKDPQLAIRLKALADGLSVRREALIRRTALVDRELNTILPGPQEATYAKSGSGYGGTAQSLGRFKRFSS